MESKDFHFPFQPYSIQREFMSALYKCINEGKIGIFESPTGTGKSLSLICGSLTWLRDQQRSRFNESLQVADCEDEPDWVIENLRNEKRQDALDARNALQERLAKARAREAKVKRRYMNGEPFPKRQKVAREVEDNEAEEDFMLDDYESDEDKSIANAKPNDLGLSKGTQALMKKLGIGVIKEDDDAEPTYDGPRVFYCSRTHSQLSQFANELRKVKLPPAIEPDTNHKTSLNNRLVEELKYLTLGSRKNLCINTKVNKLGSVTAINEKCMDLQKNGTAQENKCPYLPNKENESIVHQFRDHAISKIRDIEDMGELGKEMGICPYYASRAAIPESEIITLPYPLLLQQSAREALNVVVQNQVVIIDEAHNLMDSICGIYSTSITLAQLQKGREQLIVYLQKFRNRLKGKNRVYVTQIVRVLDALIAYLQQRSRSKDSKDGEVQVSDLLSSKGVDQINLYKLNAYVQESHLARKVDGYVLHKAKFEEVKNEQAMIRSTTPVLMQIQSFLLALMNPSSEGRFFYAVEEYGISLNYLLLDTAPHFQSIVSSARAVILAGGTMSPMEDYITHLFPYVSSDRIMTLSCGHIIPPENLVVYPLSRGPNSEQMEFTFEKRNRRETIVAAGLTLLKIMSVTPDGVVAFFPSYTYLETCLSTWKTAKAPPAHSQPSLLAAIQAIKPLFTESKSQTSTTPQTGQAAAHQNTETLLQSYTSAIQNPQSPQKGALLLAVLSGSLSEGINFSDSLGRCILVFGLPFPNPHSPTWLAKKSYIQTRASSAALERGSSQKEADEQGRKAAGEFYLNGTMRAVNQAIGRAIRHFGDYAAVVLVDGRYEGDRIGEKLPAWMKGGVVKGKSLDGVVDGLKGFFEGKKMLGR